MCIMQGMASTMSDRSKKPNVLGVILARAGSQGLPNKHLLPLLGRAVIEHTFDDAAEARSITRLVVSTDCPKVTALAGSRGLETIHRPAALATADASVQGAMLHAMREIEGRGDFRTDALVVLYGNIPVRPAGAIDAAVALLLDTGCDSVRSFCPVGKWHPAWMAELEGERVRQLQANMGHRRQDLRPLFLHDGAVVAVSRASMLRGETNPNDPHAFFGEDRRAIRTEPSDTVEIDHRRDLYWAEAVLRERRDGALAGGCRP